MKLRFFKLRGFSLVEVMITLTIVSVILAAFTPVITKKIKKSVNTASSSARLSQNCSEAFGEDCLFCDRTKQCLICNKACGDGTYKNTDTCTCESCKNIDKNCSECTNDNKCTSCVGGYFLQDNKCIACPEGFYCKDGLKTICPEGFYSAPVSSSCSSCPAGTYSNQKGANSSSCSSCPAGTYSNSGASFCTNCPLGKWSSSKASSCELSCDVGYMCANGSKIPCTAGTYSSGGKGNCTDCPSNYYCPFASNKKPCPAGKQYLGTKAQSVSYCTDCLSGQFSLTGSSCSYCVGCETCYSNSGVCMTCPDGKYINNATCVSCPVNCATCTSSSNCTSCKNGYSGADCSTINCSSGCESCTYPNVCNSCKAGYYKSGSGCTPCPIGQYSALGALSCKKCPAGTYSSIIGSSSCRECETGYYCTGGNNSKPCSEKTVNCTDCDKATGDCKLCSSGFSVQDGLCKPTKCYVGCAACRSSLPNDCLSCLNGYKFKDGACVKAKETYNGKIGRLLSGNTYCLINELSIGFECGVKTEIVEYTFCKDTNPGAACKVTIQE